MAKDNSWIEPSLSFFSKQATVAYIEAQSLNHTLYGRRKQKKKMRVTVTILINQEEQSKHCCPYRSGAFILNQMKIGQPGLDVV